MSTNFGCSGFIIKVKWFTLDVVGLKINVKWFTLDVMGLKIVLLSYKLSRDSFMVNKHHYHNFHYGNIIITILKYNCLLVKFQPMFFHYI